MTRKRMLISLLILALISISVWLYQEIEWVEKTTDLGPPPEIRQQEFLAAERFLALRDVELKVEQGFTSLDPQLEESVVSNAGDHRDGVREPLVESNPLERTSDVIVIGNGYGSLSDSRAERLLEWVSDGGNLIVSAQNPFLSSLEDQDDPIFDFFGVFLVEPERDSDLNKGSQDETSDLAETDEEASSKEELPQVDERWVPTKRCEFLRDQVPLTMSGEVDITLGMDARHAISFSSGNEDDFFFWTSSDRGIQMIQAYHGDGIVTFLSDIDLWKNSSIACFDNAYFLNFFAEGSETVWFLVNQDSPSLIALIARHFTWFLIFACLMIALCIWFYGQRFGSILPNRSFDRRKILEHIDASASFMWRQSSARWSLIESVKKRIELKMSLRYAQFEAKTISEQAEMISKVSQLPAEQIEFAFFELTPDVRASKLSEQQFTDLIKALKTIEERL